FLTLWGYPALRLLHAGALIRGQEAKPERASSASKCKAFLASLPLSNERRRRDESVILPLQKLGETQGGEVGILTGDDLNAGGKARRRQADRRDRRWQVECT